MQDYSPLFSFLDNIAVEYEKQAKPAPLVSIKVGGAESVVVFPTNITDLCKIVKYLTTNRIKYFILCLGTNTYFSSCFDGVVICTRRINKIYASTNCITAECGASVFSCCEKAKEHLLSGLEFAYGIPGGIGGSVFMNASAYERSFSDVVQDSLVYDIKLDKIINLSLEEHNFKSKHSIFKSHNYVLLSTRLSLNYSDKISISSKMENYLNRRIANQPIDYPSAGSVFVRPKNGYASKLIDDANLKGKTVGGAQVSMLHAGFIVNIGGATSSDVNSLIELVRNEIKLKFKVSLEKEIIYVE